MEYFDRPVTGPDVFDLEHHAVPSAVVMGAGLAGAPAFRRAARRSWCGDRSRRVRLRAARALTSGWRRPAMPFEDWAKTMAPAPKATGSHSARVGFVISAGSWLRSRAARMAPPNVAGPAATSTASQVNESANVKLAGDTVWLIEPSRPPATAAKNDEAEN